MVRLGVGAISRWPVTWLDLRPRHIYRAAGLAGHLGKVVGRIDEAFEICSCRKAGCNFNISESMFS